MSIDELLAREAIRKTLARYNSAGDRLRIDEFVSVFTADAVYEAGGEILRGAKEIRAWLEDRAGGGATRPRFVRHNLTTCHIELAGPGAASVRTYYLAVTDIGPDHSGYYADRFVEFAGEWLIAHRKVRLDWSSPDSRFVPSYKRRLPR